MAHVLVVELPGGNDTDVVQAALDAGHDVSLLSARLQHYRGQPAVWRVLERASDLIEVPEFEAAELERRVLASHAACPIGAVLCLIDTRLVEAAQLARRLGLRFLDPGAAALLRDKYAVRCRLRERGIAQPAFALATTNAEVRAAVEGLDLPVLIKPSDGYGSQNIVALRHAADLDPWLSPLDDLLPCRADYGLGVRANDRLLVERFMTGRLVGCDTFSAGGVHRLLGVHDKLMFEPPSFALRGSTFVPDGPAAAAAFAGELDSLRRYAFAALDAVGFDWGAAHIEILLTDAGPRLVEINPRLVGAKMPRLVGRALGRSLHADLIELHLHGHLPLPTRAAPAFAALRWIVAEHEGLLERVALPSADDPRIVNLELLKAPGQPVRAPMENADRIGYVTACASVREEAESLAQSFVDAARIVLRSPAEPQPPAVVMRGVCALPRTGVARATRELPG